MIRFYSSSTKKRDAKVPFFYVSSAFRILLIVIGLDFGFSESLILISTDVGIANNLGTWCLSCVNWSNREGRSGHHTARHLVPTRYSISPARLECRLFLFFFLHLLLIIDFSRKPPKSRCCEMMSCLYWLITILKCISHLACWSKSDLLLQRPNRKQLPQRRWLCDGQRRRPTGQHRLQRLLSVPEGRSDDEYGGSGDGGDGGQSTARI